MLEDLNSLKILPSIGARLKILPSIGARVKILPSILVQDCGVRLKILPSIGASMKIQINGTEESPVIDQYIFIDTYTHTQIQAHNWNYLKKLPGLNNVERIAFPISGTEKNIYIYIQK